ncbi:MAG: sporulation integral membrane protein YtvI [Clostridia bacterium]|nr:sporulation integral membrane protein YtvI [Clostridia bacterium]
MTDVEKRRKFLINTAYYLVIVFLAVQIYKYTMGIAFPLFFAFCLAVILQRPRNFIVRKTFIKKGFASVLCVLLFLGIFAAIFVLIGIRVFEELRDFGTYLFTLFSNADELINTVEDFLLSFVGRLPDFISKAATDGLNTLFTQLRSAVEGTDTTLTDSIADGLGNNFSVSWITTPLSGVISTVSQIPSAIISIVISIVAACFMTAEYDYMVSFIKLQFPPEKRKDLSRAKRVVSRSLGKMGKAYLLIMIITFIEVFTGLSILRLAGLFENSYIAILAVIIAIVDIAPMLGTGTILLPWTVFEFISGDYGMAIGLLILYAVITVIRQIIEPKLVAGQLGLSPVITISAMYLGLKLIGFWGIFIAPLIIIILKILTDEGIIHLWKSPVLAAREKEEKEKAEKEEKGKKR